MSKTILVETNGFTPVIDSLAKKFGFVTSLVFGRVWRYCQMEKGLCTAAQDKIAEEIGASRWTVIRHLKILVENGYLKDLTPGLKNRPHVYEDTGKANSTVAESNSTVAESNTHCSTELQPTVAESNMKIVYKIEEETIKKPDFFSFSSEGQGQSQNPEPSKEMEGENYEQVKTEEPTTREEIIQAVLEDLSFNIDNPGKGKQASKEDEFIEYALERSKEGEDIHTFTKWWKDNFPEFKFWSMTRMREMWPKCFYEREFRKQSVLAPCVSIWDRKDYVPAPERKQAEAVPCVSKWDRTDFVPAPERDALSSTPCPGVNWNDATAVKV
jgi:DNA-binding Lrp family transcriptional regulator